MSTIKGINSLDDLKRLPGAAALLGDVASRRHGETVPMLVESSVAIIAGAFVAVVPVITASEVNGRDWRRRSKRTDAAWRAVSRTIGPHLIMLGPAAAAYHAGRTLHVDFVRLGGRRLDSSNLPTATKAVEDAVCWMIGADDGDPRWEPRWYQEPGGLCGVRVEVRVAD